jgi:hypothetical protein
MRARVAIKMQRLGRVYAATVTHLCCNLISHRWCRVRADGLLSSRDPAYS